MSFLLVARAMLVKGCSCWQRNLHDATMSSWGFRAVSCAILIAILYFFLFSFGSPGFQMILFWCTNHLLCFFVQQLRVRCKQGTAIFSLSFPTAMQFLVIIRSRSRQIISFSDDFSQYFLGLNHFGQQFSRSCSASMLIYFGIIILKQFVFTCALRKFQKKWTNQCFDYLEKLRLTTTEMLVQRKL